MSIIAHISKLNSIKNNISLYQSKISGLNSNKANTSTVNGLSSQISGLSSSASSLASQMATKAYKDGQDQIRITRDTPLGSTAYSNAPLVIQTSDNSPSAPGIGFHNPGKEGAMLIFQDTQLRLILSSGEIYELQKTKVGNTGS